MRLTRRSFLATSAALPFALKAMAQPSAPRWVLLGTDKGEGIYRATWNATTGELGTPELAIATEHPTYLAMHPRLPVLYAANEAAPNAAVSSFQLDTTTASLTAINSVSSCGAGACYISIDRKGHGLFVANYSSGSVACCQLTPQGRLEEARPQHGIEQARSVFRYKLDHPGANPARQDASHMHCVTVAPTNDFVLGCDLGADKIRLYRYGFSGGSTLFNEIGNIDTRPGSGPRHVAFHPNGRWLYCIYELDCTIDLYQWNKGQLTFVEGSTISTKAPTTPMAGCTGCEIAVSDDGRFVYANTRGENSLTVFRVDPKTGLLTEQQRVQTGGRVTRLIAFDPSRRWLLCMNQGSDSVTVFAHDPKTGKLGDGTPAAKPKLFKANSPMCVEWV